MDKETRQSLQPPGHATGGGGPQAFYPHRPTNSIYIDNKKIVSATLDGKNIKSIDIGGKTITFISKHTGVYRMMFGNNPGLVKDGDHSDKHSYNPLTIYKGATNGREWTQLYNGVSSHLSEYSSGTHTLVSGIPINDYDRVKITYKWVPRDYHSDSGWGSNHKTFTKGSVGSFSTNDWSGNSFRYKIHINSDDTFDIQIQLYGGNSTPIGTFIESIEYL